jgi:hypothetical protein
MTPSVRRSFAFLSACGFAASIVGYIDSFSTARVGTTSHWWIMTFSGAQMDAIFRWCIVLLPVLMALAVPIFFLEYPESTGWGFSWKVFERDMPRWVAPCFWLLQFIAAGHFIWFAAHSGGGAPEIQDEQYVLAARSRILKILTQPEYLHLRAAVARTFATIMISMYFLPLMYWWFRRNRREAK